VRRDGRHSRDGRLALAVRTGPRALAFGAFLARACRIGTCVVGACLALGCDLARERVVLEVAQRLDASSFDGVAAPRHGPVAQIGDEAREVVVAPEEVLVSESLGVVPVDGTARVEVTLPESARALPDSAFLLTTQELPFAAALPDDVRAQVARQTFSKRRDEGWRLRREAADPSRAVLEVEHPDAAVQMNLRLTALLPAPESLESRSFSVPEDGRLVLAWGLATAHTSADPLTIEFVAKLQCGGAAERELVREEVSLARTGEAGASGWHEFSTDLDGPAESCRLRLANRTKDGGPPRGAVWAVPQILAPRASEDQRNLVLISLDTLRADHVSGYGYRRPTTPEIDARLLQRGTTFTDVISTFPQTDISHLSMMSGLYPAAQPTRGRISSGDRLELLAERLQTAGFETAAYTEDALISGAFGFWFGFDTFTERTFAHADRGRPTFEDGVRFLASHRNRRFFLFLHTYKTHDPYVASAPYDALWSEPQQWNEGGPAPLVPPQHRPLVDRYDRTIREADALVATLLDALENLGLAERTLVVLLSDHGESFGEHGMTGHGFTPHMEQLIVPLVLRGPGIPPGLRIRTPSSLVDVTPTLLDLLGLAPLEQSQGLSLKPALEGVALAPDRPLFFSWLRKDAEGVRHGRWKFHRTRAGHELFDLETDPQEWKPERAPEPPARETEILGKHAAESEERREGLSGGADGAHAIDEKTEKSLKALGYL